MPIFNKKPSTQDSPKKPFWETGFGKFCKKVSEKVPALAGDIITIATSPNPVGAGITVLRDKLKEQSSKEPRNAEIAALMAEMDKFFMTWEKEMFALETADRQDARSREVEIAKTGKIDWLMLACGFTALVCFIFLVYTAVYKVDAFKDNPVLHQIVGMVEGVTLTMFAYYFGSSKGSAEKTRIMSEK